jgi:tetratricopeptide (TPR) repeat protein
MIRFRELPVAIFKRAPLTCAAVILVTLAVLAQNQQSRDESTLYGTVRDAQGKAISSAVIRLQANGEANEITAQSDREGKYTFASLPGGAYTLRVTRAGYAEAKVASFPLKAREAKSLDLTLQTLSPPQPVSSNSPQFFDQPQFTVSGVTDAAYPGGHGSDTVIRTKDSLAKATASLANPEAAAPAVPSDEEKSLRADLQRDPHNFEANSGLGRLLVNEGKSKEAIPYLQNAAGSKPGDYRNSLELATAFANAGDFPQARDQAQPLLAGHDNAEVHHLLADVQEKLGDPLAAVREYQRAAELDPSEPNLFDWGSELLLHHASEPAEQVFTRGSHLFPGSSRMLIGLGAAEFGQGNDERAAHWICRASDLNPEDPIPYRFLAKMQAVGNLSEPVLDRLHRFLTSHPDSAEANFFYAAALMKQNPNSPEHYSAIEPLLKKAVALDPKYGAAYLQLGIVHLQSDAFPQAIADFRHAIQVSPDPSDLEEAHFRLARAYRESGKTEEAKAEIQLYQQMAQESAQRSERQRREIRQFVYTLRDQPAAPSH